MQDSEFTFEDLSDGEYSITVSHNDFIEETTTVNIELPEDPTSDLNVRTGVLLTQKAPPVTVNNNEESVVETAPSDDPDEVEEKKTTLKIPPNTFPADVVDENGNVEIRVTRSSAKEVKQGESGGTMNDRFTMEPAGVTLNNPIEMSIPFDVIPGVEYVLQPGNIPLTVSASGGGSLSANLLSNQTEEATLQAEISVFQVYFIEVVISINVNGIVSGETQLTPPTACGAGGNWTYQTPANTDVPAVLSKYAPIKAAEGLSYQNTITLGPIQRSTQFPIARHAIFDYTVTNNATNATIANYRQHLPIFSHRRIVQECHNSGGG